MVTQYIERTVGMGWLRWTVAISVGLFGSVVADAGAVSVDDSSSLPATSSPTAVASSDRDTVAARLAAARAFLASLPPDLRSRASASLSDPDRDRWSYLPGPRAGLRLEELDAAQRAEWRRFLACTLSEAGLVRVDRIRATEPVHDRGGGVFTGPDVYAVRFFGLDGAEDDTPRAWSWRVEGHHLRTGETFVDGRVVASTPFMLGSVRRADAAGEVFEFEDAAAARLLSGVPRDRIERVWSPGPMPGDLLTAMAPSAAWRLDGGLSLAEAGDGARAIADEIVDAMFALRPDETVAESRRAWKATPAKEIRFAWVGDRDRTKTHQWRLVAPTLVVEFSHSGGDANHGHLAVRHPEGEFPAIDGDWTAVP